MNHMKIVKLTLLTPIPDKEVLAIGYQNECLIGYISKDPMNPGCFIATNDNEELTSVYKYILLSEVVDDFNEVSIKMVRHNNHRNIPITIDGVEYPSRQKAKLVLGKNYVERLLYKKPYQKTK